MILHSIGHCSTIKANKAFVDGLKIIRMSDLCFDRGNNESTGSPNRGNCLALLSFLAENKTDFHYNLSTYKVFYVLINALDEIIGEGIISKNRISLL